MKTTKQVLLLVVSLLLIQCSKDDGPVTPAPDPINQPDPDPVNQVPGTFTLVNVPDNETDVAILPTFTWNASTDPDGDAISYDVYLDTNTEPSLKIAAELSTTTHTIADRLLLATAYHWKVVAKDNKGGETESADQAFTTRNIKVPEAPLTSGANFSPRSFHSTLVFDNKI